jgi:methionyl-tRNA synthetase
MYVWIDALANYLTVAGWSVDSDGMWPCDMHTIAKDILKFHGVYWPAFLIAAGIPLYRRLLVHGWWTVDQRKMGKSMGNAVDPFVLKDAWGLEPLRYYLLREVTLTSDADMTEESFLNRYNHELVDLFANLILRVFSNSLFPDMLLPAPGEMGDLERRLIDAAEALPGTVDYSVQFGRTRVALEAIWDVFRDLNRYISSEMPWRRVKDNPARWATVMYVICDCLRIALLCLWPFMPGTAAAVLRALGISAVLESATFTFGQLRPGTTLLEAPRDALFLRKRTS